MAETSTMTTTIIPYLVCRNGSEAVAFYEKAFGAQNLGVAKMPDGRILNAALSIDGALVYLCDEFPERGGLSPQALGGTPVTMQMMVPDCDVVFQRAVDAGCIVQMPMADMFWGDRYGSVVDPYGHQWAISTTGRQSDPEEVKQALASM